MKCHTLETPHLPQIPASINGTAVQHLSITNSTILRLKEKSFQGFHLESLEIIGCQLQNISHNAFTNLSSTLLSLDLSENSLTAIPRAIQALHRLQHLDLSQNRIKFVSSLNFRNLKNLETLKLGFNALRFYNEAFAPIAHSLLNLDLRNASLRMIPLSVRKLRCLTYVDLSANNIEYVKEGSLRDLHNLTGINLESNKIHYLPSGAFDGIEDTLTAVSLRHNKLEEFPNLRILVNLQVLDVGFNAITKLTEHSLESHPNLILLALDGNPMETMTAAPFEHLSQLRGLNFGGTSLRCDCKMSWIVEFLKSRNIKMSEDGESSVCGHPAALAGKPLNLMVEEDFRCDGRDPSNLKRNIPQDESKERYLRRSGELVGDDQKIQDPIIAELLRKTKAGDTRAARMDFVWNVRMARVGSSVLVKWTTNIVDRRELRIVFREFGKSDVKVRPSVPVTNGQFTLEDMPTTGSLVVCLIEEIERTESKVPATVCSELAGESLFPLATDQILLIAILVAVALIVLTILIVACRKLRKRNREEQPTSDKPSVENEVA